MNNQNQNNKLLKIGCAVLCAAWAVIAFALCFYVNDYDKALQFDKGRIFYTVEEINVHFIQCLRSYPQALLYPDRRFFTLFGFPFVKVIERFGFSAILSMRITNAMLSVFVLYFFMAVARKLKLSPSFTFLACILLIFHPLFVFLSVSTLPDIIFVLFLLLSLFYILDKKLLPAAFFASFLPFIRLDGTFVVLLLALIFIAGGTWRKTFPVLFLPVLLYLAADTVIYHTPFHALQFFREQYNVIYSYTPRRALPPDFMAQCFRLSVFVLNPAAVLLALPALLQRGLKKKMPEGLIFLFASLAIGAGMIFNTERVPHGRMLLPLYTVMLFFAASTLERIFSTKNSPLPEKICIASLFALALFFNIQTYQKGFPEEAFRTPHFKNLRACKNPYAFLEDYLQKHSPDYVFVDFYSLPEIILCDDRCVFHAKNNFLAGFLLDAPLKEIRSFYYDSKIRIILKPPPEKGIIVTRRKPSQMEQFPGAHLLRAFEDEKVYVYTCCP